MRYMLRVHIQLIEIPEPPEEPHESPFPRSDTVEGTVSSIAATAQRLLSGQMLMMPSVEPGGFDFRKSVAIVAPSFESAAKIVGEFDNLTQQISLERV